MPGGPVFTEWSLSGADVTRGTLPILTRAFAEGKLHLVSGGSGFFELN